MCGGHGYDAHLAQDMTKAFCCISWNVRISLWFIQKKGRFRSSFWCRSSIPFERAEHEKAQKRGVASSIFGWTD